MTEFSPLHYRFTEKVCVLANITNKLGWLWVGNSHRIEPLEESLWLVVLHSRALQGCYLLTYDKRVSSKYLVSRIEPLEES